MTEWIDEVTLRWVEADGPIPTASAIEPAIDLALKVAGPLVAGGVEPVPVAIDVSCRSVDPMAGPTATATLLRVGATFALVVAEVVDRAVLTRSLLTFRRRLDAGSCSVRGGPLVAPQAAGSDQSTRGTSAQRRSRS